MKKQDFLRRLHDKGRISLVSPSNDIADAYLVKSSNALRAADLLYNDSLFEESIPMSYYAMYNCVVALMRKCGIKCENHAASIILLEVIFCESALSKIISDVKSKRIGAQYYVDSKASMADAEAMLGEAQRFTMSVRAIIDSIDSSKISEVGSAFSELVG